MTNPYTEKVLHPEDKRTAEEHAAEGATQSERMIKAWREDWSLIIEPFALATKMSLSEALLFYTFQQLHALRVVEMGREVAEHRPYLENCEHCQRRKHMEDLSRRYMEAALKELKGDDDKWRPLP